MSEADNEEIILTRTEDLFLEALIARHRCGEQVWTFEGRHRKTAKSLEEKGLIGWKSGIVERTILAWLSEEGRVHYMSGTYVPPILKDRT